LEDTSQATRQDRSGWSLKRHSRSILYVTDPTAIRAPHTIRLPTQNRRILDVKIPAGMPTVWTRQTPIIIFIVHFTDPLKIIQVENRTAGRAHAGIPISRPIKLVFILNVSTHWTFQLPTFVAELIHDFPLVILSSAETIQVDNNRPILNVRVVDQQLKRRIPIGNHTAASIF
jgi:hypothetical protein